MEFIQKLDLKQAKAVLLNETVTKWFPPCQENPAGGNYAGKVKKIEQNLKERTGEVLNQLLFLILYEDGDEEHVLANELSKIIDNKAAVVQKMVDLGIVPANKALAKDQKRKNPAAPTAKPAKKRQARIEEDEAVASPAATSYLVVAGDTPVNGGGGATATSGAPLGLANRQPRLTGFKKPNQGNARASKRKDVEEEQAVDAEQDETRAPRANKRATDGGPGPSRLSRPATHTVHHGISESMAAIPWTEDGSRHTGLPGHLKSIELINFMCHEHMEMEFGSHVTFVSGTNGSGKSAVLQALQACLGVKASQTGRAPSMKHFIRTGEHEATVRVTLWNKPYKGYDAFAHDAYGDTITVERRFSISGASSNYALKDSAGRTVGRRRDDLDAMLSTLGINAANPVTVMTQDTARNFLAGSSNSADKEKFNMYMEATQLGTIAYNLTVSKNQINEMESTVEALRAERDGLVAAAEELKKKVQSLTALDDVTKELQDWEKVLAWSALEDQQAFVEDVKNKLEVVLPEKVATAHQTVAEKQQVADTLAASVADKQAFLTNFGENANRTNEEAGALKNELKDSTKELKALEKKLDSLEKALQEKAAQKEDLLRAVEETQGAAAANAAEATRKYTRDLENAQSKADQEQQAIMVAAEAVKAAVDEQFSAQQAAGDAKRAYETALADVSNLKSEVAEAQKSARNKLIAFGGDNVVRLVNAVAAERRFSHAPVGPIGQYLSLTDQRWGKAVDKAIGFHLNTFLVHNRQDYNLLVQIMKNLNMPFQARPNIVVMRLDLPLHNIPAHKQPAAHLSTIYRMLEVTNSSVEAAVKNFLVDTGGIEKIILVSNQSEAFSMCQQPNVRAAYMPDGGRCVKKNTTIVTEPNRDNRPPRLGRSGKEMAMATKELLKTAEGNAKDLFAAMQTAHKLQSKADQDALAARKALQALKQTNVKTQQQVEVLMSQMPLSLDPTQQDGEEDEIQRDIMMATQACVDLSTQLNEKRDAVEHARNAVTGLRNQLNSKMEEVRRLNDENGEFVESFESDSAAHEQAKAELEAAETNISRLSQAEAQLQAQYDKAVAGLENLVGLAEACCTRDEAAAARDAFIQQLAAKGRNAEAIALFMSQKSVVKKIEQVRTKIRNAQNEAGGSLEDLGSRLSDAQKELHTRGARAQSAIDLHESLESAYSRRREKLRAVDEQVEEVVNKRFNGYMRKKNHLGRVKLDRKNQTLQLMVQVDNKGTKGSGAVRDLKQLSGGERSYTTVAFALALGGETSMPFRAMDEFDVFMDAVNRRVAMTNLLMFAKEQPDLQFIFLTPQDMAAVEEARQACSQKEKVAMPKEFIKIVTMRPARQR